MRRLGLIVAGLLIWAQATPLVAAPLQSTEAEADSSTEQPGFSHRMTGTAILEDGETIDINMLIGFQKSSKGWYFRAGPDYVFRDAPPRSYFLNFNLDGRGNAYVLEFSDQPLQHFQVTLEDYEIELMQASGADIQYGMRLRINDRQYLFDRKHPRVRLDLSNEGLVGVVAEHTLRDLSIRRAQ